ncbi:MAG: hypothetical protein A2Y97_13955 [Nitrospirae bacterium RBG_13_39_12]|nr:MAG: hypothetical protein A2Y97_13955 [Nitrospirae bacterium RBG_13_39_12]
MNSKKLSKTDQKLNDRQIVYSALMEHAPAGMTKKKAAELAGYNPKSVYRVEKVISKYSLKHPKRLKKASKVVDAFLSGKAVGDSEPPSPAVIRATADMIYDRFEPVTKTEPVSSQPISFTQVNINWAFINSDEPIKPVEITDITPVDVNKSS